MRRSLGGCRCSLELHLSFNVILDVLSFSKQVQSTVSGNVHLAHVVILTIIHLFFLQSGKFERILLHIGLTLLLGLLLTENSRFGEALLVDFGNEWISLLLGITESIFSSLLLFMLSCLVFKGVFVEHLVLSLPSIESIRVATVIFKLVEDGSFGIISTNAHIFDVDLIDTALIDQSLVLIVADLAFLTRFELLPGLLFHHGGISIEILSLEANLLQFLSKSCFFLSLFLLLGLDLAMNLKKTLLFGCLSLRSQGSCIILLLGAAGIISSLTSLTSLLNLFGFFH